jgi:hypothetical protein
VADDGDLRLNISVQILDKMGQKQGSGSEVDYKGIEIEPWFEMA